MKTNRDRDREGDREGDRGLHHPSPPPPLRVHLNSKRCSSQFLVPFSSLFPPFFLPFSSLFPIFVLSFSFLFPFFFLSFSFIFPSPPFSSFFLAFSFLFSFFSFFLLFFLLHPFSSFFLLFHPFSSLFHTFSFFFPPFWTALPRTALHRTAQNFAFFFCRVKPRRWRLWGRGGFTRQPENSKRAHFRAAALQTPPIFHEKTPKRGKKE